MLATLMAATLVATVAAQQTDTVFAVPGSARLAVESMRGEVVVRTWDQAQVRVVAEHGRDERIEIDRLDGRVRLQAAKRYGPAGSVHMTVTIPATMAVDIDGAFTNADLDGVGGEVRVETANGNIRVRGGNRIVRLHTMNGEVSLSGAEGRIDLSSMNGDVTAEGCRGSVIAETVNGGVTLRQIVSDAVEATSVNGDVSYDGTLEAGGDYRLGTHGGDVTVVMPAATSAAVSVSTYSGEIESDFPIELRGTESSGRRFSFTLGSGQAHIEIESFSGDVRLRRP